MGYDNELPGISDLVIQVQILMSHLGAGPINDSMGTFSLGVCFAILYLVGATMYRSIKAGWRPDPRLGELTDILLWREQTPQELADMRSQFDRRSPDRAAAELRSVFRPILRRK